jgi:hypothetical protein
MGRNKMINHGFNPKMGDIAMFIAAALNHPIPLCNGKGSISTIKVDQYKTKFGEKTEVLTCISIRFTWVDSETGETDVNLFGANGMNDWDKGFGSAMTYAERYFLLKYFHIPSDEDDLDNLKQEQTKTTPRENPPGPPIEGKNPWLNEGTEQFTKAKAYIDKATDKNAALTALRGTYAISTKTKEALLK